MEHDEAAALHKRMAIWNTAARAMRKYEGVPDRDIEASVDAFARITPPAEPEITIGLVTINSLNTLPSAQSRKPGNVVLNWRKLIDIVPDVSLAGLGAATLPIAPAWSAVLGGLYVWNKLWKGSSEEFSDAEAVAILALWKNRSPAHKIGEEEGFKRTNELREAYSLPPLTIEHFAAIVNRLVNIDCIELTDGVIWMREWVRVKYN